MKKNIFIRKSSLYILIAILLISAVFVYVSAIASESSSQPKSQSIEERERLLRQIYPVLPWDPNLPTEAEREKLHKELLNLQVTTFQQRNELISKLVNTIKDPVKMFFNYQAEKTAIDILSQIKAIEAIDILLDIADFESESVGLTTEKVDPKEAARRYPAVDALIKIRPPYESVIKKIKDEESFTKRKCYVAVLIGTETVEITRYIIEKAIEKETDSRKLTRLNSALAMLNKYYPQDKKDVKK